MLRLRLWALYFLNELGDSTAQAIAVGQPLLDDARRVLGPDHPSTLGSRGNLANACQAAGRAAEAIPLHEAPAITAVSEAACGGPVPVTGAMTCWHGMRSPVYDVMPAPPAIWRLSGLDRNCLSAITLDAIPPRPQTL